jgi:hypothetical protein
MQGFGKGTRRKGEDHLEDPNSDGRITLIEML